MSSDTPLPPAAIICSRSLTRNGASQAPSLSMPQCWLARSCSGLVQVTSDAVSAWVQWPEDSILQHSSPLRSFWLLLCSVSLTFPCTYLPPSSIKSPSSPSPLSDHHVYPAIPLYLLHTFFCIYLPSVPTAPSLPIFLIDHLCSAIPISIAIPHPISCQWSHFSFLVSVVTIIQ